MPKERDIFEAAIEIDDPVARKAFVEQSCSHDDVLRQRVNDLLDFEKEDQSFLSEEQLVTPGRQAKSLIGAKIGRYRLLEQIGEGGCGIVYMAEQREPVRRKVALKIVKPGMDTREIIARFEAERQALSMMDHPNIAKVLDGGETDQGRPYFVMELVDGVPITEYCDANRMTPKERLKLFIKVCRAIQHAHQKAIIHRDIKPSNVLVTLHDGSPVPRVIDFGVAKAIGHDLTDRTLFTHYGQIVGTPQYMSPEQAERSDLDVDTRSDIYSLGVLLYELLTGQTPLDSRRLKQAAFDEVLRIVREEEPQTPSNRISTLGAEGTVVGQQRSIDPTLLGKLLRGDIDWIVMRALEKDRRRRFDTVGEFVADIDRHLSNEPVLSSPPSSAYRLIKFVRRNRLAVCATIAVVGALAVGLALATLGLSRANIARNNAIASNKESQLVLDLLRDMLATDPEVGRGRDLTVGKMLDDFVATLPDLFDQPKVAAEIHSTLGRSYQNLNFFDEALVHYHIAIDLYRDIYGNGHAAVAQTANNLSQVYHQRSNLPAALEYSEIAVKICDRLDDYSRPAIRARANYCKLLTSTRQPELAESILRQMMTRVDSAMDVERDIDEALAKSFAAQGKIDESLVVGKRFLEYYLQRPDADDGDKGWAHILYAQCLEAAGEYSLAADHVEQAIALFEPNHDTTSLTFVAANRRLFRLYARLFRFDDAMKLWGDPLMIELPGESASAFNQIVLMELDQGEYHSADQRCYQMLERVGNAPEMAFIRNVAKSLLAFSMQRRNSEECQRICDEMLDEIKLLTGKYPETFCFLYSWALLHKSNVPPDDAREALSYAKVAIDTPSQQFLNALAHYGLAQAYLATSRPQSAEVDWRLAYEQNDLAMEEMPKHCLFFRSELDQQRADLLESTNRTAEARRFLEQAFESRMETVPSGNIYLADARMRLAEHLINHGNGADDLKAAEEHLLHDRAVIEARPANDYFRTRWNSLVIELYDIWEKPDERAKWKQERK